MAELDTHGYRLKNSKRHRDKLITQVPIPYLKWMVNARHQEAAYARAELDRRGTVTPELEISGHAIDRASLLCRRLWHEDRGEDEGLHAWLVRITGEAMKDGKKLENGKIAYKGMRLAIEFDCEWPILKTVMPGRKREVAEAIRKSQQSDIEN